MFNKVKTSRFVNEDKKEVKRSVTSKEPGQDILAKRLTQMNLFDQQNLAEEERKYNENEDFTTFLKPHARKRKVAKLFMSFKKTEASI